MESAGLSWRNDIPDAPPAAAIEARSLSLGSRNSSQNQVAPFAAAGGLKDHWDERPNPALIPETKREFHEDLKRFSTERGSVFLHRVSRILVDDALNRIHTTAQHPN